MSKTRDFLDSLSDHELAFFVKYKLHTYMLNTQQDIKEYVEKRNLNQKAIDQFITKRTEIYYKKEKCCTRCGSNKLLINNVEWTDTYGKPGYADDLAVSEGMFYGKATYKDEIICNVCDFWLQDPNNRNPKGIRKKTGSIWDFISSVFD